MTELTNTAAFVLAGNATITLQNGDKGKHYTYKIVRSRDKEVLYFVHLLRGPDNEEDYTYIGCYYSDTEYFHAAKRWRSSPEYSWPAALRQIKHLFMTLDHKPPRLRVFHEGRCGRCGRKLTTPESITSGFGPECINYV